MPKRSRKVTHHLPLYNLEATKSWKVAGVTLRPAGWLVRALDRVELAALHAAPGLAKKPVADHLMRGARRIADERKRWATAQVAALSIEEARDRVRDVVALLRLFQRGVTRTNLDMQTFGLPVDVFAIRDDYVVLPRGRLPGWGGQWHGVVAEWRFDSRQIADFEAAPRFVWLEGAVSTPADQRTDLQERVVTSLRFANIATVLVQPPIRVALRALALESLFRDEDRDERRHRVARRIAYLTCGRLNRWMLDGQDDQPHRWPERPACFYLEANRKRQVLAEMKRLLAKRHANECSWYLQAWDLFEDRDSVLHDARTEFTNKALGWYEINLDVAILSLAAWAERTESKDLRQLDEELEAFVAKGVRDWDSGIIRAPRYRAG